MDQPLPNMLVRDEAEPPIMCEHVHAETMLGQLGCPRVATLSVTDTLPVGKINGVQHWKHVTRYYCEGHNRPAIDLSVTSVDRAIMEELQDKVADELDKKIIGLNRPGHPGFMAILEELKATHFRKSQDYGNDADPFANIRSAEQIGIEPWLAAWVRARDKVHRIDEFCRKRALANEGIEDGWLDLASYCIIALHFWRESKK